MLTYGRLLWVSMSYDGVLCSCRGQRDHRDNRDYREINDYADIVARDLVVVSALSALALIATLTSFRMIHWAIVAHCRRLEHQRQSNESNAVTGACLIVTAVTTVTTRPSS